jgi:hypothetical protein
VDAVIPAAAALLPPTQNYNNLGNDHIDTDLAVNALRC